MSSTPSNPITYRIFTENGHPAIHCLRCDLRSFHPQDVRSRFCANCGVFHDDLRAKAKVASFAHWDSPSVEGDQTM